MLRGETLRHYSTASPLCVCVGLAEGGHTAHWTYDHSGSFPGHLNKAYELSYSIEEFMAAFSNRGWMGRMHLAADLEATFRHLLAEIELIRPPGGRKLEKKLVRTWSLHQGRCAYYMKPLCAPGCTADGCRCERDTVSFLSDFSIWRHERTHLSLWGLGVQQ